MNALFQRDMNNSPRAKVFSRLHSRYFINCLYTEMMTFTNSLKNKWNNEQQFLSFFSSFVKSSNDKVYLFTGIYYIIGKTIGVYRFLFFFLIKSRKSSTQLCAFFYHSTVVLMQLTLPVFMGYIDYWETSRIFCRHRTSIFFAFLLTCLGKLRINYQLNINWNEIFNSWFMYYVILDL